MQIVTYIITHPSFPGKKWKVSFPGQRGRDEILKKMMVYYKIPLMNDGDSFVIVKA